MNGRRRLIRALASLLVVAAASGCPGVGVLRDYNELQSILQSGNDALLAERYDEAISHYDAGLALSPGEPSFLIGKSIAVRMRGAARYNESLTLSDAGAKSAAREDAKRDFLAALSLADEAVQRIESAQAWETVLGVQEENRAAARAARAEPLRIIASRYDKARADEALAAIHEYVALEGDADRRSQARLHAGQMLLDVGRGEQAAAEYRHVLAEDPNNLDAVLGVGMGLSQSGDRAKYREAAVYLRRFVERAPESHPLRSSAKDVLDFMDAQGDERPAR